MKLYIRNQDRTALYSFDEAIACLRYRKITYCKNGEMKSRHTICMGMESYEEIAEYDSKERCIAVLDDIAAAIGSYIEATAPNGQVTFGDLRRVYTMPER